MQLVSAIKMKKSQAAAIEAMPYQTHLESMIKKIISKSDSSHSLLFSSVKNAKDKDLVIFVTANKGLCGAFNFNLFRFVGKQIDLDKTDFIVMGKRGVVFILKMGGTILADFSSNTPINNVSAVFNMSLEAFLKGAYRSVSVLYNKFISTLHTEPVLESLLPMQQRFETKIEEKQTGNYLIEPSPKKIIDTLLRSYVEEKIRNCLIQGEAGEHSSRMIAMKNASDAADDMHEDLTRIYHRARQAGITQELIEIMAGAEAVT